MKDFVRKILASEFIQTSGITNEPLSVSEKSAKYNHSIVDSLFNKSPLLRYLDMKTGAISGTTKTRRSLANIYAIYSILHFYSVDFYQFSD